MLYIICGNHQEKVEQKFKQLLASLVSKKADATVFRVDSESWRQDQFEELMLGQTLFDKKYIVAGRNLFEHAEAREFFEDNMKLLNEAAHIFILAEGKLPASLSKKADQYAEKVLRFDQTKAVDKAKFNVFALGDSLGARDRKLLWVNFAKALHFGIPAEEIYWQYLRGIKNMLLLSGSDDPQSLGLHPFVVTKTKKYLQNFSTEELQNLHHKLVDLYHEVRQGKKEMDISLEKFVMEI